VFVLSLAMDFDGIAIAMFNVGLGHSRDRLTQNDMITNRNIEGGKAS
jgi:hypothetical protein